MFLKRVRQTNNCLRVYIGSRLASFGFYAAFITLLSECCEGLQQCTVQPRNGVSLDMYIYMYTYTYYTYIHTYRQTDRQTNRHTYKHTDIHTYRQTYIHTYTHTYSHIIMYGHTRFRLWSCSSPRWTAYTPDNGDEPHSSPNKPHDTFAKNYTTLIIRVKP